MATHIADLRREYKQESLDLSDVRPDPIAQFRHWFEEALASDLPEPNAMVLATATPDARPSARVVLLKGLEADSFLFYTNYSSRKGRDIAENPQVALTFNWLELERQVRIEGRAEKLPPDTSTEYFQSRPRGSQIGAWASPQSQSIPSREALETRVLQFEETHQGEDTLPRPDFWGGYRVIPSLIEFWQGRPSRLHDRICYTRSEQAPWRIERLAP